MSTASIAERQPIFASNLRLGRSGAKAMTHDSIGIHGNFEAMMLLGIVIEYQYVYTKGRRISEGGIPNLSVPSFFTLGPMPTIDISN
jgi:hypothetical protein